MKTYIFKIVTSLVLVVFSGNAAWELKSPSPFGGAEIIGVKCLNRDSIIITTGDHRMFIKSINSDTLFPTTPVPNNSDLIGWQCFGDTCYSTAKDTSSPNYTDWFYYIRRSYDGGVTWEKLPGVSVGYKASLSQYWVNTQNCWITIWYQTTSMQRTVDGGATWSSISVPGFTGGYFHPLAIQFLSESYGLLLGSNGILYIMRDGFHWEKAPVPNVFSASAPDTNCIYAATDSGIYRSKDKGTTWDSLGIPNTVKPFYNKYIMKLRGDNGGCIIFNDAATGWLYGRQGCLLSTSDSGSTWKCHSTYFGDGNNTYIDFSDDSTGYIFSSIYPYTDSVLKTTDYGATWTSVQDSSPHHRQPVFIGKDSSWYCGNLRSLDSGATWDTIHSVDALQTVYPISSKLLYGTTAYNICKSVDSGRTWNKQALPTYDNLISLFFRDSLNGIVLSDKGAVFKTTDGATWKQTTTAPLGSCRKLLFTGYNTGFILGSDKVYRTTDTGSHWDTLNIPKAIYTEVSFFSRDTGWILGGNGTILKTVDGGKTWGSQACPVKHSLKYIARSPDNKTYWIVGDSSTVLFSMDDGGEILGVDIPSRLYASSRKPAARVVYSNLTSKSLLVDIQYALSVPLTLTVYDCGGRRLFEKTISAGTREIRQRIPLTQLPAGLYLCTVKNNRALVAASKFVIP